MIRTLLVVIVVAVLLLILAAMAWGWRRRGRRQEPGLGGVGHDVPADLGAVRIPPVTGLYIGSTFASSWQDRVVAGGLGRRAAGTVALYNAGALIDRDGDDPIFIPALVLQSARLEPALAGKVLGRGGLLVLRWTSGEHELDTGFRADDRADYLPWIEHLGAVTASERPVTEREARS